MTLIEQASDLKKLEQKAAPGECIAIEDDDRSGDFIFIQNREHWAWNDGSNSPDAKYLAALRNAAPDLLKVAGMFQPEDSRMIGEVINAIDSYFGGYYKPHKAALRRLQEAAQTMEAKR
jgi:hypothetical protein